jgi:hypothetical protein
MSITGRFFFGIVGVFVWGMMVAFLLAPVDGATVIERLLLNGSGHERIFFLIWMAAIFAVGCLAMYAAFRSPGWPKKEEEGYSKNHIKRAAGCSALLLTYAVIVWAADNLPIFDGGSTAFQRCLANGSPAANALMVAIGVGIVFVLGTMIIWSLVLHFKRR